MEPEETGAPHLFRDLSDPSPHPPPLCTWAEWHQEDGDKFLKVSNNFFGGLIRTGLIFTGSTGFGVPPFLVSHSCISSSIRICKWHFVQFKTMLSAQAQLHIEAKFYNSVTYTGILFNYRSFDISQSGTREQASRAMNPGMHGFIVLQVDLVEEFWKFPPPKTPGSKSLNLWFPKCTPNTLWTLWTLWFLPNRSFFNNRWGILRWGWRDPYRS